ncbi:SMC5-SMC6 complex localization factor protein 1 isoform X3 [Strongylocentrotus purpuratus]|uniref:BRCT domain-containing protein n=1 Tax=Strongylocentrotus purpuratus TaxID=7668 RepID=A0A7M7PAR9_STRPU|nr:SMC5-SMC6 complex localization factor protein 1 isoform X3 [Strongylocentrotus purpuratus]
MESKESSRSKFTRLSRQREGDQRSISASSGALCDFLLSGFREEHEKKELMKKIRALGGRAKTEKTYVVGCTHVISYKPIRSEKFLCGVASGKWILKPEFVTDSFSRGKWQAESKYEWSEGDASENVLPGLLRAPRRWRKKVTASGHGAFHSWNILLHVTNRNNRDAVYRRVLEAGGGQCVKGTFPIKEPARLVPSVTHVIVDKCHEKDVQCLEERGIPCLLPEFIAEYLFQENPNMTQYHVTSALMTPTQTLRQTNVVVSTVSAKKDHDTFLKPNPRARSQGKKINTSGREGDTPGSTMSMAEESTSSDPGRGVKRKLHFSPNQLREALQILKKRKLSSQHLPLVPYTMLIPRPKKTFQCASHVCPSIPFSANICNSIEANIEESHWLDALSCIGSSISTLQYPPPHMLYSIMQHILLCPSLMICRSAVHILKQVLCLHSPACYVSLRGLYLDSMIQPQGVFKMPYQYEHWNFVDAVIRRALYGQNVIQDVKEHEDEEAVKVAMETGEMLLHFLVSLFEEDFMASARRTSEGTEKEKGPSRCILAQILWPSVMEQTSRKVPNNVQRLMTKFIQAVKMAAKCDDWVPVTTLLSTLMLIAAEIHVAFGELPGNKNSEKGRKEFAEALASRAKKEDILATRSGQEMFLSMLKPSWLCMGVAECLLHNYDDQLLDGDRTFWVGQPLTMRKIVSYYFYLVPPTAGPVQKEDTGMSKSSPLQTISNQQLTSKNGVLSPKSSPRKTNVNRKNPKGETPLHVACIKNNIARVRELLSEPDIDVNARDHAGWTPLHEACNHGHTGCVEELLKFASGKGKITRRSLLTVKNKAGSTPGDLAKTDAIKEAILGQRSEVSRLLVVDQENENNSRSSISHPSPKSSPRKTNVNRKNHKGETPLHYACIKNNITRVRELLNEPDIDVNARDNAGWTPLHEACNHGHTACVEELLKFASGKGKITSTESRSMQTLDLLAAPSECGTTPLHDAVTNNHIEVVKLLVEAGGRSLLTVKNKAGSTPGDLAKTDAIKEAILGQRSEVSRLLVVDQENENISHRSIPHPSPKSSPRKTNVNRKNPKGETPLHVACIKNNIAKVRELLNEPDIDINARDNADWTPLHEACNHGHTACVKELLKFVPGKRKITGTENGRQTLDLLAAPSDCGTTPLHDAVNNNQIEAVKLLVEAGGRSLLTVKNKAGYTPVDLAQTEVMKEAILGQRSEVSKVPAIDEKNENKENSPQPHPSKYRQLLGPPFASTLGYVTEEECEAFASIVMAMLQSYVRSHDLHRVKAEVDIIKGQKRLVNNLQANGVNASVSETTPFVSVVGSPTFTKASLPLSPSLRGPVYSENCSSLGPLLEDMEVFMELSRHTEGFKAHLRQIAPSQETPSSSKATVTLRVTRSMRLITHLCAVVS